MCQAQKPMSFQADQKQIDKEASGHTILISFVKRTPSITFLISGFSAGVAFQSGNFALVSFLFALYRSHVSSFPQFS